MVERSDVNYPLLRLVSDVALAEVALLLSGLVRSAFPPPGPFDGAPAHLAPLVYLAVGLIWGGGFLLLSLYDPREMSAVDDAQAVTVAATLCTLALAGVLFFLFPQVSRLQILVFYLFGLVLLVGSRLVPRLSRRLRGQPRYAQRKVLILGAGDVGCDIGRVVAEYDWAGLELVGFLDDRLPVGNTVEGAPVLGKIEEVGHFVDALDIHEIVVAYSVQAYDRFFELVGQLQDLPARVHIVPDHVKVTLLRTASEEFAGVPMILVRKPSLTPFERQIKRLFDLVLVTLTLILISPLLVVVAIAIYLDSPGPILYKQRRVGENGRIFWMYKFRSMVKDADQLQDQALRTTENGQLLFKHPDDPRVTRVGKFIRRTSLDELPQLLNVFKGEMSVVGPRPELPWIVERYEPWQRQRLSVPQGITGWWQVNGRSDKPMHLYTEDDLYYIQNYSFLLDVLILWRTIGAVIRGQGAF